MSTHTDGQVVATAAEIYDEFFVPALFQGWTSRVADVAALQPGERVLDVACGTGILACEAAERVGPDGEVIGLDINDGMLTVARRKNNAIAWRQGDAEDLPFADNTFDAVVSQFGLMFFADRQLALREMARVLRPGGRLAVAVWDCVEHVEGYPPLADLLERLYGAEVGAAVRSPFVLGNPDLLTGLFADVDGFDNIELHHQTSTMRFPSMHAWLTTEIRGWVLADRLDDAQFTALLHEAQPILAPYVQPDGTVALRAPAYIVSASKAK
ncbi:MAG TPA: class I SAM-dependent methyltransferase [Caldilineaceae bacterium]|nr:class I SAM-dependent methyltransferase [Caldilineaceae bacterium]